MAVAQKTRSTVQRNGSQVMQKQNLLNAVVTPQQVHQVIQSALQMVIGDLAYSRKEGDQIMAYVVRDWGLSCADFQVDGVMPAIVQQFLKTLTIFVFLDPNNSDRIIESYKIEFEYEGTAIMASFGSSDVPSSSSTAAFTARSPMAVRELRSKYLEIKLDFNDKASSDYRLPNFAPYTRELWMRTPNHQVPLNIACGRMNTAAKETALSFGLAIQSVANYLHVGEEISDEPVSQPCDGQLKHEAHTVDWLLRNIPDVGPVATYPFGPQEIGVADLPGVRGIFGRFEERIGPWDKFEMLEEETLVTGSQDYLESHETLPRVKPTLYPPEVILTYPVGNLLAQLQAPPVLPDAPLVSSKPVPLRQAAETKKTHIAKKAGSRQPGVTSPQPKPKPKTQSLREREIKKQTELLKDKQKQVHTPKSNAASAVKTAGPAPPTLAKSTAPLFGALNLLHCDAVMNRA
ncbi:uncharacterized protein CcaverHIS019_0209470 [Cutaneotrichosporon cavernicola]|uniref:HORMA domain-containing protein n=1 Tax=Cutaneotrichosporon cavernicola TaxID=279322 RepID=A0AA48L1G3_9TREE|nr:uncharacterized protein CcaverHIS019_0209470 [Cutaneotrichosporon cavernicola]BEI89585.1 hypothetical protein CcaverHIS019_0209470 [Cutaneotrichosporon cavernicola]